MAKPDPHSPAPVPSRSWPGVAAAVAALVILAVLPSFLRGFWIRTLTTIFMYAGIASSLNIMAGYAGYADFGHVIFFGLGAYTTGILMAKLQFGLLPAMAGGALVSALLAVILGVPILRLKGHYFAIATLGVMEATAEIVLNWPSLTGGGRGMDLPLPGLPPAVFFPRMYYGMLALATLTVLVSWWVRRSALGYGLRAIKADEDAAQVAGVNTVMYKVSAWALSASLTGLIGGLYAYWISYLEPKQVFSAVTSIKAFIMILLGGLGTVVGPVVGAFILEILSDLVWARFLSWHLGTLGLIVVLVVLFMPKGFVDLVQHGWRKIATGRRR